MVCTKGIISHVQKTWENERCKQRQNKENGKSKKWNCFFKLKKRT